MQNLFTKTSSERTNSSDAVRTIGTENHRNMRDLAANQQILLVVFLVIMVAVFSILNPRFLSLASFGNIAQDWVPAALLATGQTFVIITAGVDLSVGSVMGISAITAALIGRAMNEGGNPVGLTIAAAVLGALLVGLFWG